MATITIGAVDYHSYATVAEADSYLEADFTATAWRDEEDEDQKARALVTASRLLDRLVWLGEKTDEDQTTAWPRDGVPGVDDGTTPQQVADATCVLASMILDGNEVVTSPSQASNIKRQKAGSVEQEFFRPGGATNARLPLPVAELLRGLLGGIASLAGSIAYGTDGCSTADDSYGLSHGY